MLTQYLQFCDTTGCYRLGKSGIMSLMQPVVLASRCAALLGFPILPFLTWGLRVELCYIQSLVNNLGDGFNLCIEMLLNLMQSKPTKSFREKKDNLIICTINNNRVASLQQQWQSDSLSSVRVVSLSQYYRAHSGYGNPDQSHLNKALDKTGFHSTIYLHIWSCLVFEHTFHQ